MPSIPLLPDFDPTAIVAHYQGRNIARGTFLAHILAATDTIPRAGQVLNLCADRYAFAVALFAAIINDTITILPNSAAPHHLADLAAQHVGIQIVGDAESAATLGLPNIDIASQLDTSLISTQAIPSVDFDQKILQVYTSGSTGTPMPHRKTFGRVRLNILAGAERFWSLTGGACSVVGTTPIRHLYGLESSLLLPILGGGSFGDEIPFFPADIVRCLEQSPAPRLLVSTPFHLRNLVESDIRLPRLDMVLSSTAPLAADLAAYLAGKLNCPLVEIYGSTETGQLATRLPAMDSAWETLAGVTLKIDGEDTWAYGDVYEAPQMLNDIVEIIEPSRFRLIDRKANIINVAGKRNSLSCLNAAISQVPGVIDAAFFMPNHDSSVQPERLAALVVAPGVAPATIQTALREQIDPVFLPRPLIYVDAVPRDANGKLQATAMQAIFDQQARGTH